MQLELETILAKLFTEYMKLPASYGTDNEGNEIPVVVIKGQNVKLHNTPKLQITIGTVRTQSYANNSYFYNQGDEGEPQYITEDTMNEQVVVQVDVYSANNEARKRYKEVQSCLSSMLALQYQEKYHFQIGQTSSVVNTTGLDGSGYLNRFTITFNCITWFNNITEIDYYDKFPSEAQVEEHKIKDKETY